MCHKPSFLGRHRLVGIAPAIMTTCRVARSGHPRTVAGADAGSTFTVRLPAVGGVERQA